MPRGRSSSCSYPCRVGPPLELNDQQASQTRALRSGRTIIPSSQGERSRRSSMSNSPSPTAPDAPLVTHVIGSSSRPASRTASGRHQARSVGSGARPTPASEGLRARRAAVRPWQSDLQPLESDLVARGTISAQIVKTAAGCGPARSRGTRMRAPAALSCLVADRIASARQHGPLVLRHQDCCRQDLQRGHAQLETASCDVESSVRCTWPRRGKGFQAECGLVAG